MATETKNLYQRLLAITEEIGKIDKTGTNTMQGYKFIEQAQVVAEVRVQLAKHGVMIIPETVGRVLERHEVTRSNGKPGVDIHARVASRYTLVNADNPDERMVCDWDAGESIDSGDKATNKATTASHKYFLMKLFNISDKDDPDADSPQATKKPSNVMKESSKQRARGLVAATTRPGETGTDVIRLILNKEVPETEADLQEIIKVLEHGN